MESESTIPLGGEQGELARERAARITLESAARAMDEFMSLLSHDLRSPLNAMVGWLHVLRGAQTSPEMTERALAGLSSAVERQRRLVDQMLDATRILTGRIKLEVTPVNAAALLRRLATRFNAGAAEKSIVLDVTPVEIDATVLADPMRIEEILATLIDNAIRKPPPGGRVVFAARARSDSIDIDVTDSGAGFEAGELARLLAPVGQSDPSASRGYGSFALGLTIAKALTALQGGALAASSRGQGQGASFVLRLRRAVPSAPAQRPIDGAPDNAGLSALGSSALGWSELQGTAVLVLDDSEAIIETAAGVLRDYGAQVTTARSIGEAIDLYPTWARAGGERIFMCDLDSLRDDGLALIARIRRLEAERGLPRIPSVALSAQAERYPQRTLTNAGFDLLLPKPIGAAALRTAIAPLLGR